MTSIDTNLLFHAFNTGSPQHRRALDFVTKREADCQVVLSELVLVELYRLLRNPVTLREPLSASEAVDVIQSYREHPHWIIAGFPGFFSEATHNALWALARTDAFAYRRIYDARLALTLQYFGVTEFQRQI